MQKLCKPIMAYIQLISNIQTLTKQPNPYGSCLQKRISNHLQLQQQQQQQQEQQQQEQQPTINHDLILSLFETKQSSRIPPKKKLLKNQGSCSSFESQLRSFKNFKISSKPPSSSKTSSTKSWKTSILKREHVNRGMCDSNPAFT